MPSADFAAAQQRIAARRSQRSRAQNEASAARAAARLPTPLSSIWNAIKGREGTRPAFRVGQVDAELLDEELLDLLKSQVGEGLKYFGSHITDAWAPEILLALRTILFKLSIWDNNASYGAHLQGLRYMDARSTAPDRPPPKKWQKVAYGMITVGGRYAWTKWQEHLLASQEDFTRPQSDGMKLASRITEYFDSAHDIASLTSFLIFLVNGRYRTITDRILRLRLTPTSHSTSREVSFEYLNRQLVWHAFTEFLLFLLPLVGISRWRRILSRAWRKIKPSLLALFGRKSATTDDDEDTEASGELAFLPERTCAICYRDQNPTTATEQDIMTQSAGGGGVVGSAATDITNPYEAVPCGCIYCFACLAQRIANEEGEGWTCLRCGELVKECKPWNGDVLEESRQSPSQGSGQGNVKSVGFVADGGDQDDEKSALREVDPIPESDDEESGSIVTEGNRAAISSPTAIDWSQSLDESAEWARASDDRSSDEHSEEYDEDEEEEGEELEYDQ